MVLLALGACSSSSGPIIAAPSSLPVEILAVSCVSPAIEGTGIRLDTRGLDENSPAFLQLKLPETTESVLLEEYSEGRVGSMRIFLLSRFSIEVLGLGSHTVDSILVQGSNTSLPVPLTLDITSNLPIILGEAQDGTVHREMPLVVRGDGIISDTEGTVVANIAGNFTPTAGSKTPVSASLVVAPVSAEDRTRGTLRLTTAIGGIVSGEFLGTLQLVSTLKAGAQSTSGVLPVSFNIQPASVLSVPAEPLYLGQRIPILGLGFLGASSSAGEATLLQLQGTMTDETTTTLNNVEIVTQFVDGGLVEFPLDFSIENDALVANAFGTQRGTFNGTITPILVSSSGTEAGLPYETELSLGGVRQVAVIRFLPGFFSSLDAFGLSLSRDQLTSRILDRLKQLYAGINIEFHLETPPDNFIPLAVSTLDIGGSDPNGLGAFGYDNTPGKDVGNLRLNDRIGGENAATQQDGSPGYGGVFIESYLWWSSTSPPAGPPPPGAPEPDPLFDDVFDPLRKSPATLDELLGSGSPERVAQVERAIRGLSHLIAETAAHELGHSLGLAAPYGSTSVFHNPTPEDGCIMDSGIYRPLGERMAEPEYPATRFCGDNAQYLRDILPL